MGARGFDHLVLAFRSLARARDLYARMGFTLTPVGRHPWGTENSLVQLDGAYLELLAIADGSLIPDHGQGAFSFGAFNRDFLAAREGFSMLALETSNARADHAAFEAAAIRTHEPFLFSRKGKLPSGKEGEFAFTLCFASDPRAPQLGFFTCERRTTVPFWQPAYQCHANTACAIAEVLMVADEPRSHRDFLAALTGSLNVAESSAGLRIATPRGRVMVMARSEAEQVWGDALPDVREAHLAAFTIEVAALEAARAALAAGRVRYRDRVSRLDVAAKDASGVAIGFVEASSGA